MCWIGGTKNINPEMGSHIRGNYFKCAGTFTPIYRETIRKVQFLEWGQWFATFYLMALFKFINLQLFCCIDWRVPLFLSCNNTKNFQSSTEERGLHSWIPAGMHWKAVPMQTNGPDEIAINLGNFIWLLKVRRCISARPIIRNNSCRTVSTF